MRTAIIALVTVVTLLATVVAGPRKVLVLPLDGSASTAQKSQLNATITKLAKANLDGDVTKGDTTFAETAAAVGCDPASASCAETVRSTLGVDDLVYGTANTVNGSTSVTVSRVGKGAPPTAQTAVIAEKGTGDDAAPALEAVFTGRAQPEVVPDAGSGSDLGSGAEVGSAEAGSGSAAPERPSASRNFFDTRERKLGVGLAAGGVIFLAIGISFWSKKSDLQGQIDDHPTMTLPQLQDLKQLEDEAASKALWGNVFVALGLAACGVGAYYLYKDHKNRSATITPAPTESGTGMTLVLGGRW